MSSVHVSATMMSGGGGYSVPAGERLDFDEVINETVELSENILYASPISATETSAIINQMQELFTGESIGAATNALIGNIDSILSKFKSNVFYLGPEAKKNIDNMNLIGENITALSNYSNQLDVSEITRLIGDYNSHLKNLKKNARRELLEKAAKEFNAKNVEWPDYPKTRVYKTKNGGEYDGPSTPYRDDQVERCNGNDNAEFDVVYVGMDGYNEEIYDTDGMYLYTDYYESYTYTIHKYKRIKCTNWLSFIQSPFDPTFEQIEAQFDLVKCPVPYDRNNPEIKASAEKNEAWGINGNW